MIKLTYPKTHTYEIISSLLRKFEIENKESFNLWVSIESKDSHIEIGELGDIQALVYEFLRENTDIENHNALIAAWMDMRGVVRKDKLGLDSNLGGVHHE